MTYKENINFEKEADEYVNNWRINKDSDLNFAELVELRAVIYKANKDGIEFGYNKANEWHYNGVPENENDVLCQIDKDIFVVGYFHQKNKQYYSTSGEWLETVIAWKEIQPPKE